MISLEILPPGERSGAQGDAPSPASDQYLAEHATPDLSSLLREVAADRDSSHPAGDGFERLSAAIARQAETLGDLGRRLVAEGLPEHALTVLDCALALVSDDPVIHHRRGNALRGLQRFEEAVACHERAIALRPDYPQAWNNRGIALLLLHRLTTALASFDRAAELAPDDALTHNNRGNALLERNRLDEALASYERATALDPALAEAFHNRGVILGQLWRHEEALQSLDQAISIRPGLGAVHLPRGGVLADLGRHDEALLAYEQAALSQQAGIPELEGLLLVSRLRLFDWSNLSEQCERILGGIADGARVCSPLWLLPIPSSPAQQQRCAELRAAEYAELASSAPVIRGASQDRIRLGYFSADFRDHAVGYLSAELFELHDCSRFELVGFSSSFDTRDAMHERIAHAFDRFIDISRQSDADVVALARSLEIDIAIDLSGYTTGARTPVFAQRCAPVQVNYLGYPGTMGADFMDYIVADPIIIPPDHRPFYTEKVAYLPHSYQANDRQRAVADWEPTRAELGLPESAFVFCCFNNSFKITPDVFEIWMKLLGRVPGSVLWLLDAGPTGQRNLCAEAQRLGIEPARLHFAPRIPMPEHLARQRLADLALDTFYYGAHTTASDALWVGLPVVTHLGDAFAARVAASLINAVGLPELITRTHEEYEALAYRLATQPTRLNDIRVRLAEHLETYPLFDSPRYTRNLERAYEQMWRRHRDGLAPTHIFVEE